MRPGQNKRMRGRNNNGGGNNRKGPNPLTRSYESNGPDVKIRGTAHHIGEKYLQLARDAQSSGDPVMAESYLQHAEHYFRLIATAQQAQQQAAYGYQRPAGEQVEEDDGDDDFNSLPDRFASPAERVVSPPPLQPYEQRQPERQGYNGGDRQPYERGDRPYERQPQHNGYGDRQNDRQDERPDRSQQDRQHNDRQPQDRPHQDRPHQERPHYDNRNGRDRSYGDRLHGRDQRDQTRDANREPAERQPPYQPQPERAPERIAQPERPVQSERPIQSERPMQSERSTQDRPFQDRPRDYDNRPRGRGPRPFRDAGEMRQPEARQPMLDEPVNGLPAFITAPTRVQPDPVASEPPAEALDPTGAPSSNGGAAHEGGEEPAFHLRPRRRRRSKAEFAAEAPDAPPASDPVGE